MKRRPSIFDLVRKTGFSHGTISRALNNRYGINPDTRRKILKAAEELGYSPSASARSFKTGRTNRWGILLPHLINPYYAELFEGLDAAIRKLDHVPYLALSHHDHDLERALLRTWSSGEVDAAIVEPMGDGGNEDVLKLLHNWRLPVLSLHSKVSPHFDSLTYDFRASQQQALQYLFALGHRSFGFVGYEHASSLDAAYLMEFSDLLRAAGVSLRQRDHLKISRDVEAGRETFRHWTERRDLPTVLICSNDSIALHIMSHCPSYRLEIPRDLSILGRDDVHLAACAGLSTLRTDRKQAASRVVEIMYARTQTPANATESIVIPSELVIRSSLGGPGARK